MSGGDLSGASMLDLFRIETENQTQVLTSGLLTLERTPDRPEELERCMRAAHSLKGAARIVDRGAAAEVAHAMEDCFVAAQERRIALDHARIDQLLRGVDLLVQIAQLSDAEAPAWWERNQPAIAALATALAAPASGETPPAAPAARSSQSPAPNESTPAARDASESDRFLRVTPEKLDRLLGLASESLVESRWLQPFAGSLLRLKRLHRELGRDLDRVRDALARPDGRGDARSAHADAQRRLHESIAELGQRLAELDAHDRRAGNLSRRLYDEAVAIRMRPFADGTPGLARMVRDLGRDLGRQVRLEIEGEQTPVDRDILDRLEAPLTHLLRNAVDHGMGTPAERIAAGKPAEGVIRLEARHHAGRLQIIVSDDGKGVDLARLREKVVARNLTNAETAARLSEAELLEFLFLPGFSLRDAVTDVSGRGVGLDVVQATVKALRGTVRVTTEPGRGVRFHLQLPLTLSVLRALLVEIAGEPYAFPLVAVARTEKIAADRVRYLEGRAYFERDGQQTSIIAAGEVLELAAAPPAGHEIAVVVLGAGGQRHGLAVDRLLGERELVVQPLDRRLGKLKNVSAGAVLEDGAPVLIIDPDDLVRSTEKRVAAGPQAITAAPRAVAAARQPKRVLIVDDSLTVRELERKLLAARGYAVDVAVDGMDGWNAARSHAFNLVITDIDMPRLDGFELVRMMKRDPKLGKIPVMIVSYKDRPEDRQRGLEAGADYYLTKGSFHDETLLQAVIDLIGEAAV